MLLKMAMTSGYGKCRERAKFAAVPIIKTASQQDCRGSVSYVDARDIEIAITALGKRFRPSDIKELCRLKFHHKTYGDESIDQLGITIQQLGRKAFPSISGKDFNRLLKGHFYQAL